MSARTRRIYFLGSECSEQFGVRTRKETETERERVDDFPTSANSLQDSGRVLPGLLAGTKQQTFDGVGSGSGKLTGFFLPFSDIFETQPSRNKIILSCSPTFQIHVCESPK